MNIGVQYNNNTIIYNVHKVKKSNLRREPGGLGPESGKKHYFVAKASSKKWKKKQFLYLLNKKHNHSIQQDEVPEIQDF